jgi:hypothetical protein
MNYNQNDGQQFSFITPLFPTLANTLKTKVDDVVGCIFEVECSVGGFLILKQIIVLFSLDQVCIFTRKSYSYCFLNLCFAIQVKHLILFFYNSYLHN